MSIEEPPVRASDDMAAYMREYRRKKKIVVRFGSSDNVGTLLGVASHLALRQDFKIELINESNEPVEFESIPLRKEKVLGPGVKSFVVITISRPGEYPFFDDFHQSVKGTLIVKPKE